MAEEQQGQEKTEEATPRKLEKAREEGQVARSRELNSVAIVTFGALAAILAAPRAAVQLQQITTDLFANAAQTQLPMQTYLGQAAMGSMWAVLPFVLVMFVAGIFSSIGVGGLVLSAKALQPKLARMSPVKGFSRMFSMKALVELGKSVAKFVLIAGVTMAVLSVFLHDLLVLGSLPFKVAVAEGIEYVGLALLLIGCALIVVAAIDVPFQLADHKKQMKMTKQEVKDELKDSEGKPEVKAKIKLLQQQISQRKMMEAVPSADVVITNPEHYAVAIKYDASQMAAPLMVAKGADHMAFRIREIAQAHDVPVVPMPPLARAVYHHTEAGQEIPEALYVAVAQVLAYIYQLEQYRRGQLRDKPTLAQVDVPPEMDQE